MKNHPLKPDVHQVGLQAIASSLGWSRGSCVTERKCKLALGAICYAMNTYMTVFRVALYGLIFHAICVDPEAGRCAAN